MPEHYRPRRRGRSSRRGRRDGEEEEGVRLEKAPSICISKSMFLFYRPSTQENPIHCLQEKLGSRNVNLGKAA